VALPSWLRIRAGYATGATAAEAEASYLLVLPLVVIATRTLDITQLRVTSVTAVVIGGVTARLAARSRDRHGLPGNG